MRLSRRVMSPFDSRLLGKTSLWWLGTTLVPPNQNILSPEWRYLVNSFLNIRPSQEAVNLELSNDIKDIFEADAQAVTGILTRYFPEQSALYDPSHPDKFRKRAHNGIKLAELLAELSDGDLESAKKLINEIDVSTLSLAEANTFVSTLFNFAGISINPVDRSHLMQFAYTVKEMFIGRDPEQLETAAFASEIDAATEWVPVPENLHHNGLVEITAHGNVFDGTNELESPLQNTSDKAGADPQKRLVRETFFRTTLNSPFMVKIKGPVTIHLEIRQIQGVQSPGETRAVVAVYDEREGTLDGKSVQLPASTDPGTGHEIFLSARVGSSIGETFPLVNRHRYSIMVYPALAVDEIAVSVKQRVAVSR